MEQQERAMTLSTEGKRNEPRPDPQRFPERRNEQLH